LRDGASWFTTPLAYRLAIAARKIWDDLSVVGPLLAVGTAAENIFNQATLTRTATDHIINAVGGISALTIEWHLYRYFPLLLAAFVYVIVRRVGEHALVGADSIRPALVSFALATTAVVGAMFWCHDILGTFAGRYMPIVLAVVLALWIRSGRLPDRIRLLLLPGVTGFRPPTLMLFSRRGRRALHLCGLADTAAPFLFTANDFEYFDNAINSLRAERYTEARAWCMARAIEHAVGKSDFGEAERRIQQVCGDPALARYPVVRAAHGLFLREVGNLRDAMQEFVAARDEVRRASPDLLGLIAETAVSIDEDEATEEALASLAWTDRDRAAMVFRRAYGAVLLELTGWIRPSGGSSVFDAGLAYRIRALGDWLTRLLAADAGAELREFARVTRVQGIAMAAVAKQYQASGQLLDAVDAWMDAYQYFEQIKDRARAARCIVEAMSCALAAGYGDDPRQESHALDLLRVALHLLERDRGALRHTGYRKRWITYRRDLYFTALELITNSISTQVDKAAELGLWLIESLRRTAVASVVRSGAFDIDPVFAEQLERLDHQEAAAVAATLSDFEASAAQRADTEHSAFEQAWSDALAAALVVEPTDIDTIYRRLGNRVALIYNCTRTADGWLIHTVLASVEHGISISRTTVTDDPANSSLLFSPVAVLDGLASGDPARVASIHNGHVLDEDEWAIIGRAIFPPGLADTLVRSSLFHGCPAELLVVPDGPIGGLPLAALPLADGAPLLQHAAVALVPALSLVHEPDDTAANPMATRVAVTHIDDVALKGTSAEFDAWQTMVESILVRHTSTRSELESALTTEPRPDIVIISTHGATAGTAIDRAVWLRDGSTLSAGAALRLEWPRTVVLGACWVSAVDMSNGAEPVGFPIMCLLRGAHTVVGAVAPINDRYSARVLTYLVRSLPQSGHALHHVRAATLEVSQQRRDVAPASWGGFTAWTVNPPKVTLPNPRPSYWGTDGLPRDEQRIDGILTLDGQVSASLTRVLAYAQRLSSGTIGTTQFQAAAFAADSADWTSFTVGAGTGDGRPPSPLAAEAGRLAIRLSGTTHIDDPAQWDAASEAAITVPLAMAIRRAERLRRHLGDESLLPAHVVYGIAADPDCAAYQWLSAGGDDDEDLRELLSQRVFRTDLPEPETLESTGQTKDFEHEDRVRVATISTETEYRKRTRKARIWTVVASVIAIGLFRSPLSTVTQIDDVWRARGYLGVQVATIPDGVVVRQIAPGSPAAAVGLELGDRPVEISGASVTTASQFTSVVWNHRPGETVTVLLKRNGSYHRFDVALADVP
jgi:hypothetical protein